MQSFIKSKVSNEAEIRSDGFSTYRSLTKQMPNLIVEKSEKKGKNFDVMHRVINGFKLWLRSIHGHVSYLQYYLDEYCYRYNRHKMKEKIFDNLIQRMINHASVLYKLLIA